jgi:PAS domain S-box-containing protein
VSCTLSRKPVSVAALLILGAGLALTAIVSVWLANAEAERNQKSLERAAGVRQTAFQEEFDDAIDGLAIVNRLFSRNGNVNRQQFHDLATQLVELNPYIQAYSFTRVLSADQRPDFEAEMKHREGNAVVTEIRDGRFVPAGKKPTYHVIDQIAPGLGNAGIMGLDISSIPGQSAALERARTTGLPSATEMFSVLQDPAGTRAFAVVMPVYREGATVHTAAAREGAIFGYTAIVLRAAPFVESIMRRAALLHDQDIDSSILVDNGTDTELVYRTGSIDDGVAVSATESSWPAEQRLASTTRTVDAAGMRWLIVSQRSATGDARASAWLVLAGGAAVSILLALYLQSLAVRASDLARANARLEEDIDERKRIESALRTSEERFQRLTSMSSDWYWEQDAQFRFTMISGGTLFGHTATQAILGKAREEIPLEVDEKDFEAHLQVMMSHKPFSDLEYRVRDANGQVHWMSVSGEPLLDSNGEFAGYRGTGKNITERKEAEQALRQSQTELRDLAAHQERVKEDERKRIAREIHDDLGQNLLALRIDVSLLEDETRRRHPALNERLHGLLSQVDNVVRSVRAIINDLRPPVLDLGLQCAVEWQVQQFRQRNGVSCTLTLEGGDIDGVLDEEAATSVFRILQESLSNVSRHAYATHVDIRLQRKYDCLILEIADDGIGGFPGNMRKPRSFGLIGIRERVFTLGGEFRVASSPGKGATLTITIPASATSAAAA